MLRAQESVSTSGTQATSAVKRLDLREYFKRAEKKTPIGCMFCSENGLSTDTYAVYELLKVEYSSICLL